MCAFLPDFKVKGLVIYFIVLCVSIFLPSVKSVTKQRTKITKEVWPFLKGLRSHNEIAKVFGLSLVNTSY